MAVRLGTNPIAWSNDDLRELGGDTPLETCLKEAAEAGYAGIELGHKFPRDAASLGPILEQHGLALISGWWSSGLLAHSADEEMARMRPHLDLLRAMGCPVLILAETTGAVHGSQATPLSTRPRLAEDQWPEFAGRLTEVAARVADEGLRLAYHHHMGTVVESAAEIDKLMKRTGDAVGLLLDTGHAAFAGADPAAVARQHAGRIVHVHCKDLRAPVFAAVRERDGSFLDAVIEGVFTVPGDGSVDFPAVLGVLGRSGYEGWLVVEAEQDPDKAEPRVYAELGYENLRRFAAGAGLL
ncbi:MAG: myo-inosose-2 dehydratase [Rhodospirillales bacterium]|nr:myo-inosose-2 dehydratase [Rhodospirillales bacterium]MDH3793348.1 myo-inosose-2 dehydratase [Rhodospirillales bacterium]MDH3912198.1 myo-inosose-2 dehydratase [Rhodospirillales bacterium]MDH3919268.1 myo-inosose-2 dehydratase [Rhodospirillales bacterium]MDH3968461.1 myo-inosose-2 dehydratase [Rhodospirillales bacterium]